MWVYIWIAGLLSAGYVFIIYNYIKNWNLLPEWKTPIDFSPQTKITVLVPARNEAQNIAACLESILQQNYPENLYEIIVMDDHSEDQTAEIVHQYLKKNVRLLSLEKILQSKKITAHKKIAIETGIQQATGNLIVTTDADCIVPENWLRNIAAFHEIQGKEFIAAPVNFHKEKSLFEKFQSLDFLGMMAVTGGGIHSGWMRMCNGANLAYTKRIFEKVNGFEGIDSLASGDDMLLMQKVAAHAPETTGFIKNTETLVLTEAMPTLSSFYQQRLRWATKSSAYPERQVTFILAWVFFFCCSIPLSFLLFFFGGWNFLWLGFVQIVVKAITDFIFLKQMSRFFNRLFLMNAFIPSFFMHILYIVIIGICSNLSQSYTWKGRSTK